MSNKLQTKNKMQHADNILSNNKELLVIIWLLLKKNQNSKNP